MRNPVLAFAQNVRWLGYIWTASGVAGRMALALLSAEAAISAVTPVLLKYLLDSFGDGAKTWWIWAALMVLASIFGSIMSALSGYLLILGNTKILENLHVRSASLASATQSLVDSEYANRVNRVNSQIRSWKVSGAFDDSGTIIYFRTVGVIATVVIAMWRIDVAVLCAFSQVFTGLLFREWLTGIGGLASDDRDKSEYWRSVLTGPETQREIRLHNNAGRMMCLFQQYFSLFARSSRSKYTSATLKIAGGGILVFASYSYAVVSAALFYLGGQSSMGQLVLVVASLVGVAGLGNIGSAALGPATASTSLSELTSLENEARYRQISEPSSITLYVGGGAISIKT